MRALLQIVLALLAAASIARLILDIAAKVIEPNIPGLC
jgi:hypothetical protein